MEPLLLAFLMQGGDQHSAGIDAHHFARRQVDDRDACLADQLFRLIVFPDPAEDHPFFGASVIQQELQKLQQEKMQPIQQKIMTAIQNVGKAGQYTYIFEASAPLYTGAGSKDVTADVKAEINKIK